MRWLPLRPRGAPAGPALAAMADRRTRRRVAARRRVVRFSCAGPGATPVWNRLRELGFFHAIAGRPDRGDVVASMAWKPHAIEPPQLRRITRWRGARSLISTSSKPVGHRFLPVRAVVFPELVLPGPNPTGHASRRTPSSCPSPTRPCALYSMVVPMMTYPDKGGALRARGGASAALAMTRALSPTPHVYHYVAARVA